MGKIYFDIMKDTMFDTKVDEFDSDVDLPDPDLFYRMINYQPKMPEINLPTIQLPQGSWACQWRRLKRRKWLLAATSCGALATLSSMGHYFYANYYLKQL